MSHSLIQCSRGFVLFWAACRYQHLTEGKTRVYRLQESAVHRSKMLHPLIKKKNNAILLRTTQQCILNVQNLWRTTAVKFIHNVRPWGWDSFFVLTLEESCYTYQDGGDNVCAVVESIGFIAARREGCCAHKLLILVPVTHLRTNPEITEKDVLRYF